MTSASFEAAARRAVGMRQVTVRQIEAELRALGYRLDRSLDCTATARDLSSGRTFPCTTAYVREIDSGLGFANIDARRDANFRALQDVRRSTFALVGNCIFDL